MTPDQIERHEKTASSLDAPSAEAPGTHEPASATATATATEDPIDALRQIWCEALEVPALQAQDDFFELGGDSIAAMQIVSRVHNVLERQVSSRLLFDFPRFEDFAARALAAPPGLEA